MNIFQSHGNKKQVQEIRDKLKMLYNGGEDPSKDAIRLAGSEHEIWYFSLMFCLKYSSKTYWKKI